MSNITEFRTHLTTGSLLAFIRQEYALGRAHTITDLSIAITERWGAEPDAKWLNDAVWEFSDFGEVTEPLGLIIPRGVAL